MITEKFWQGKKVFITGHTGFKGSWLSLWLAQLKVKLYGYSLPAPTDPSLFKTANVEQCFVKSYLADINDYNKLQDAVKASDPDIIIHMAAQPLVRKSYDFPLDTYQTNVIGTANILNAARACNHIKAILVITTDKCYQNNEWDWGYRENDRLGGIDPYSSSKACAELIVSSYRQSYFKQQEVGVATARAGNVIGGGDWAAERLLPDCLKAINENKMIVLRNPTAIRPWQHVLEALHGYLLLIEKLYYDNNIWSGSWNFGPDDSMSISVEELTKKICKSLGGTYKKEIISTDKHEAKLLKLDCSKARNNLKWKTLLTMDECIEYICQWQNAYVNLQDMNEYTINQIKAYVKIMRSMEVL